MNTEHRTRWTIYRRLLLLGTLPALAMFLLLLLFFTQARLDDARDNLFHSSQMIADNLAPAVEFPVVTGDERVLGALLEETWQRSNVLRIVVRDRQGNEVGLVGASDEQLAQQDSIHYFTSEIVQQPMEFDDDQAFLDFGGGSAFGGAATRLGEVEVAVSEEVLAEAQQDILWTSAGIGVILFGGTLIFIGRLAYRLSVPIEHLVESIETLPDGDYSVDPSETRVARELQSLQHAIVNMAARLKAVEAEREMTFRQLADARDKAESASQAKSDFLAMMSHEVRTPLNGVLGMLQLLEEEKLSDGQRDYINTARRSTEDLLVIINDILDFSRIERGRLELDQVSFELRQVVENCFATFRHQAEKKGLDYQLRFRGSWSEMLEVYGDPGRLRQIVAHLIANAIKFTEEGRVVVTVHWAAHSESEGLLTCEFEDSGAGIPSDRISDMFNTFEQLDSTSARRFGGTGLGLPLVQRLVELMGGHIAVDSAPGLGSVFRFVIPLAVIPTDQPSDAPLEKAEMTLHNALPGPEDSGHRALVVEDNAVNQRVAARLLENLGFHVQCANNGVAAVEAIESRHEDYDVVLMDCQMPIMDGWEATRKIRAWERRTGSNTLPILAMTADVLEGTESSCLEAGMNGYLPKPVRRESLREALQRHINL